MEPNKGQAGRSIKELHPKLMEYQQQSYRAASSSGIFAETYFSILRAK